MKRPHISTDTKVNVAIRQSFAGSIMCPLCDEWLDVGMARVLEHLVPHELGGSSEAENLRWVHKECAASKTNGSMATSAGGDLHKIAKSKRLAKAKEIHDNIVAKNSGREPGKMKSRGFDKSLRKTFSGKVEKR